MAPVLILILPVILPNSPLAQDLAPADLERRTNSYNARRALLKSNPSLFISRTRLSVRQIPIFVTERVLKRLALHAVRAFEAEVKEGKKNGLTPDELVDPPPVAEGDDEEHQAGKKQKRYSGRSTGVKQAKIVRQQDRVDPITGKGRSKGYGFIEMNKHSDALRLLRWANCNSGIGPLLEQWYKEEMGDLLKAEKEKGEKEKDDAKINRMREETENGPAKRGGKVTLIVEFSIENVQVVQRRSKKQDEVGKGPSSRSSPVKAAEDIPPLAKKRKISTGAERDEKPNVEPFVNSIIGRKRREKKKGKKGS